MRKEGKDIEYDWTGTLSTGSVVLTDVNEKQPLRAQRKLAEVTKDLEAGKVHVFDTSTFTVTIDQKAKKTSTQR